MEREVLLNVSPIDGRYYDITKDLEDYFSEYAYIKYRVFIECEWLKFFCKIVLKKHIDRTKIDSIYKNFNLTNAHRVKEIEKDTNHDVKAIEYSIREKLEDMDMEEFIPFVHFACTSEDINNLAQSVMIKKFVNEKISDQIKELINTVEKRAFETRSTPMLAHTHGQPATPTTIGKELEVFVYRWRKIAKKIGDIEITGKFSGAVGNYAAHIVAYPDVDWITISKEFVESLGLTYNPLTTQIESHDTLCEILSMVKLFNNITLDYNSDMWMYISMRYFKQKTVEKETGSSVMPHKVNPINHENSMANIHMCNSLIDGMVNNLQISRMQRDLSDSSTIRKLGSIAGYMLISITQTIKGTLKMQVNEKVLNDELDNSPEVISEAIQTVLRKNGVDNAYELLKSFTRGKEVTSKDIKDFILSLHITPEDKDRLFSLTPRTYVGLSNIIVEQNVKNKPFD